MVPGVAVIDMFCGRWNFLRSVTWSELRWLVTTYAQKVNSLRSLEWSINYPYFLLPGTVRNVTCNGGSNKILTRYFSSWLIQHRPLTQSVSLFLHHYSIILIFSDCKRSIARKCVTGTDYAQGVWDWELWSRQTSSHRDLFFTNTYGQLYMVRAPVLYILEGSWFYTQ